MGIIIDDIEMKARVLNSLNLTNHRHASYLQSETMELEAIKQFLYNKDKDEIKFQMLKRKSREHGEYRESKRTKYDGRGKTSTSRDFKKKEVICYKCNKPGHLANECTTNATKQDKAKRIASTYEKLKDNDSDEESEHLHQNDSSEEDSS